MIEHLAVLIETFPGAANQTRCFAHILNLVAKTVLRQFEGPKKGKAKDSTAMVIDETDGDDHDQVSDGGSNEGGDECDDVDDDTVDDDEDGLHDELEDLTEEELTSVKESVTPIRLVLTKVSPIAINKHQHQSMNQQTSYSFEAYLWPSKTHPPLRFPSGTKSYSVFLSRHTSCHGMLRLVGIRHMTCSSLRLSTRRLSTS